MKVCTIGISGASCSGKTTVTRILRRLLKHSVVIYQDDFFKLDSEIPIDPETQLANWDCPEAVDFHRLDETIQYVVNNKQLPEKYRSNEVNNTHDGSTLISDVALERLKESIAPLKQDDTLYLIVDGFMLYWDRDLCTHLDCKVFINASYETLKHRRESRQGYVTTEGYWIDPPGYFDKIVWPEYIKCNKHLFLGEDHSEIEHEAVQGVLVLDTDKYSIEETANAVVNKLVNTF
ncbi:P-loop containing nucleoside triphosphate hydrolase protein [Phascolomyces articulosus]|uniref:P-loop containing nucleoside triphosphate hydrolase protein n=1 Tax=Phascolomyces articulosus TaxID=60185 RepID=A0AAD5K0G9_9FUNG|nr:P-loop containing nucleoside triphosphate hydrolase protein [Phascolomyces articulosus]